MRQQFASRKKRRLRSFACREQDYRFFSRSTACIAGVRVSIRIAHDFVEIMSSSILPTLAHSFSVFVDTFNAFASSLGNCGLVHSEPPSGAGGTGTGTFVFCFVASGCGGMLSAD